MAVKIETTGIIGKGLIKREINKVYHIYLNLILIEYCHFYRLDELSFKIRRPGYCDQDTKKIHTRVLQFFLSFLGNVSELSQKSYTIQKYNKYSNWNHVFNQKGIACTKLCAGSTVSFLQCLVSTPEPSDKYSNK